MVAVNTEKPVLLAKPSHVALIMDGNGRWAESRGLPRREGHRYGLLSLHRLVKALPQMGVKYLTVYAFSSENWGRPLIEIRGLMSLLILYLKQYTQELLTHNIRLHTIGRISGLPRLAIQELNRVKALTAHCTDHHLTLALNYGSQNEVVDATKRYVKAVQEGGENPEALNWPTFSQYLDTAELPEPDLFIRTSGENRLSNFLLLQLAYAELYVTPTCWPDFTPEHFQAALTDYQTRERRYGMTNKQISPRKITGI